MNLKRKKPAASVSQSDTRDEPNEVAAQAQQPEASDATAEQGAAKERAVIHARLDALGSDPEYLRQREEYEAKLRQEMLAGSRPATDIEDGRRGRRVNRRGRSEESRSDGYSR